MGTSFARLNADWNAEPNAPYPKVQRDGADLLLTFFLNYMMYEEFDEDELGMLRFTQSVRYRLGATNDEGWYRGQCRFSGVAPQWGEFYCVRGDDSLLGAANDWIDLAKARDAQVNHYLFYFRDETFEAVASGCFVEPVEENALFRRGKSVQPITAS